MQELYAEYYDSPEGKAEIEKGIEKMSLALGRDDDAREAARRYKIYKKQALDEDKYWDWMRGNTKPQISVKSGPL